MVPLFYENQIKETFINGGRGHPPSHFKFFLLVFSKLKEDINKDEAQAQSPSPSPSPRRPKPKEPKSIP